MSGVDELDESGLVMRPGLGQHGLGVVADRGRRDAEGAGDFLVRQAVDNVVDNLSLALGQAQQGSLPSSLR